MPEALEKWPVDTFRALLPRIWTIVEEINKRFCLKLWSAYPGDWDRIAEMSIIADGFVRMAHLAVVGSFSVNGVAAVHTELLKHDVLKRFYEFYPEKFNNNTNGITHRRWLIKSNPKCAQLITDTIKADWPSDTALMGKLADHKNEKAVQDGLERVKRENKARLAKFIKSSLGVAVDPSSIFDVQIKRIHAYKRQLLNVLQIMHQYNEILDDPDIDIVPRTYIIGGKAAPSYYFAKNVIKLINSIAAIINNDKKVRDRIKVIFLENYSVSVAELVFPASEVSEQISTASKEASGTGNMKFMMNGAVTIGTMDGANIEIRDQVGDENFVTFGLSVSEVLDYYRNGRYVSNDVYAADERLRRVVDQLTNGFVVDVPRDEFVNIRRSLLDYNDEFFVLKDFDGYLAAQRRVDELYRDRKRWLAMSAVNIARSGAFSSDNTIRQYASDIWKVAPLLE
jgi:starch phosphorylase